MNNELQTVDWRGLQCRMQTNCNLLIGGGCNASCKQIAFNVAKCFALKSFGSVLAILQRSNYYYKTFRLYVKKIM